MLSKKFYLQTMIQTPVKFQKNKCKTVGEVLLRRNLLHIHFHSIQAEKKVVKNEKKEVEKNNFMIPEKAHAELH